MVNTQPKMQWKSQDIGNAWTVRGMPVTAGVWNSGVSVSLRDELHVLWMAELERWALRVQQIRSEFKVLASEPFTLF